MTLYKMELYKTLHRPIVLITGGIMAALFLLYYIGLLGEERSLVDGETQFGYAAVQYDRAITKEFEGILTDEKLQQIVDKYGFPSKVVENYGGWYDKNYLTDFVTEYFSDGYMKGWNEGEYKVAKNLIPIAESELNEMMEGREIYFGYANGWLKYVDFMQFAGWILMVWLVITLSPLFVQEQDTRMYPLLFSAEYGKSKDVRVKLLVAFSVTLVSFLIVSICAFCACKIIYGLDGAQMMWGLGSFHFWKYCRFSSVQYAALYTAYYVLALLVTCSFCIYASATASSKFGTLLIAGGLLITPFIISIFNLGGIIGMLLYYLCATQPIFLIWSMSVEEMLVYTNTPVALSVYISLFFIIVCTAAGYMRWRRLKEE